MNAKVNANIIPLPDDSFKITRVVTNRSKKGRISPVRKIPKTYRSIRGKSSQRDGTSIHFESKLEFELHTLLKFDLNVDYMVEQPVKIEFLDFSNAKRSYTPDLLINFRNDIEPANTLKPTLIEVKYLDEVRKDIERIVMEMNVAEQLCKQNNWQFRLLTEEQIHCQRLKNAKFLINYDQLPSPDGIEADTYTGHDHFIVKILDGLRLLDNTTPKKLLEYITNDIDQYIQHLTYLWHLVRWRHIGIDFDQSINMNTKIWNLQ